MSGLNCPLCNSSDLKLVTNKLRFGRKAQVYNCQGCTLTFLDQNSFKFPEDFYQHQYHQTYLTHVEPAALDPKLYYEKMKKATWPWADKFSSLLTGREAVLDIGCSTGHFLDLIKDKAGSVFGSELNRKEIEFCRETLKLDVSDEPLEERFQKGSFDYITMIYVLEHIANPKDLLLSLVKFLKPQGKIIILVPNINDPLVNFYDIREFKDFYFCIEHLFYYNQKTLRLLLKSAGLKTEIAVIQEYPITNHLNWIYRRAPSDTLASRRIIPDVGLSDPLLFDAWQGLWQEFNQKYQNFLKNNDYGDRLWSIAERGI